MRPAVVCAPLRTEWAALRAGGLPARCTGMGPARSTRHARGLAGGPVLVAGVGGGLAGQVRPGDVVVADEVRGHPGGPVAVPSAPLLASALRRAGLTVHIGPIASERRVTHGTARATLAATGAFAVDTETAWLAPDGQPFAAVRAVVDTADSPLWSVGTPARGIAALRALRRAAPALADWTAALRPREVRRDDICYATTNRQQAVRSIARDCDLLLVVGSANAADSLRLVEVALREGTTAVLVGDAGEVDLRQLAGAGRVGIVAGASAPPHLVDELVSCLAGLGPVTVHQTPAPPEDIHFTLPREVS